MWVEKAQRPKKVSFFSVFFFKTIAAALLQFFPLLSPPSFFFLLRAFKKVRLRVPLLVCLFRCASSTSSARSSSTEKGGRDHAKSFFLSTQKRFAAVNGFFLSLHQQTPPSTSTPPLSLRDRLSLSSLTLSPSLFHFFSLSVTEASLFHQVEAWKRERQKGEPRNCPFFLVLFLQKKK